MTMMSPSQNTFQFFPRLAPELRLQIWQYACVARIVSVRYTPSLDTCVSPSPPPAILQTCRESRIESLLTYSLSFGTRSSPARIYFNPYGDTLYLPRHRQMGYDDTSRDFGNLVVEGEKRYLDKVRRIAVDHVDVVVKRPWESYNKAVLVRGFSSLEEVVLVLCEKNIGSEDWRREVEFVEPMVPVEELVRIGVDFKQSCAEEERCLEEVCRVMGTDYVKFSLPTVRIRRKLLMMRKGKSDA